MESHNFTAIDSLLIEYVIMTRQTDAKEKEFMKKLVVYPRRLIISTIGKVNLSFAKNDIMILFWITQIPYTVWHGALLVLLLKFHAIWNDMSWYIQIQYRKSSVLIVKYA